MKLTTPEFVITCKREELSILRAACVRYTLFCQQQINYALKNNDEFDCEEEQQESINFWKHRMRLAESFVKVLSSR